MINESTLSPNRHSEIMSDLATHHDVLLPLLRGGRIHYLDLPLHSNIGDLLIMLGTLRFFEKNRLPVARYGMYFNYPAKWAEPGDIIVLHGGGNFGDIYGPFQNFREELIAALPNNRIIIMPQSIHFSDPKKLEHCCKIFSQHRDLHICVRDSVSAEIARKMSTHIYLLPDMAHQLWPIKRSEKSDQDVLQLRRRDGEAASTLASSSDTFDWEDLVGKRWIFFLSQIAERAIYHATRYGLNKPFANMEARIWIWQARRFVDRAVKLFSRYESIESDRLHAHILSSLLSIPHRIGDNHYGKNSNYIAEWTHGSELLELTGSKDSLR